MPIKNDVKQIRICDLCGKEEGKHLKSKDFFDEAPVLIVQNHEGTAMSFQLNVDIWNDNPDDIENTLGNIIEQHNELSQPQQHQQPAFINIIPIGVVQQQQSEQEQYVPNFIVCKGCYNNMVNMIQTYGKFDKETKF